MDKSPSTGTDEFEEPVAEHIPQALFFCTDLMFGVQLQNMARHAGINYSTVRPGASLPAGDILIVDMSSRGDWQAAIREAKALGIKIVAFGPHMDADSRRKAKGAGASRVLANSNLGRDLPQIFAELAGKAIGPDDTNI
ncbi:MAG: hypothetical protein ABI670_18230 [Chloroflexota bacterium]